MAQKPFKIHQRTATGYDQLMPQTIASQVIEENEKWFVNAEEKSKISEAVSKKSILIPRITTSSTNRYYKLCSVKFNVAWRYYNCVFVLYDAENMTSAAIFTWSIKGSSATNGSGLAYNRLNHTPLINDNTDYSSLLASYVVSQDDNGTIIELWCYSKSGNATFQYSILTESELEANREWFNNGKWQTQTPFITKQDCALSIPIVTTATNGIMSKTDKIKIDTMPTVVLSSLNPPALGIGDFWFET